MEFQEYPHMLYQGGEVGEDWVIVADAAEEAEVAAKGYVRAGEKPPKRARKAADE